MSRNVILRIATKVLCPNIFLFALYVQFHGDYGPGGGFQAGVILAAGFVLYALVYGLQHAKEVLPPMWGHVSMASGALLYGSVGFATVVLGSNFLDYNALAVDHHTGQHWGIFAVEFGVLLTVFGAMISIFYAFAGRRGLD
jgi:multicomponent Na+:H+ antiporter subunit B